MEGNEVYKSSYKEIEKMLRSNATGKCNIDYDKLDERTTSELRLAINKVLVKRRGEVYSIISGVH